MKSKARLAVVSPAAGEGVIKRLSLLCGKVVTLPPDSALAPPVARHADMIFSVLGNAAVFHKSYYREHAETVEEICRAAELELILTDCKRGEKYPFDCPLNVLAVGEYLFCKKDTAAPEILARAEALGMETVNVKQGYAACSALAGKDFIITADKSIFRAASEKSGIDALLISPGHISLEPYDCGFIGGASGAFGDSVFTVGSLSSHPDGERIKSFLSRHGAELFELDPGGLRDVGGIKIF